MTVDSITEPLIVDQLRSASHRSPVGDRAMVLQNISLTDFHLIPGLNPEGKLNSFAV